LIGSFVTPAFAQADDDVEPVSDAPAGQYASMRGVQGPAGMFSARLLLDINLSDGAVGEPISIVPDLHYSVTDKLQLGLTHSGPMGWQARPGLGLCLTGEDSGCPEVYDNVGFDLMYGLVFGETHLSAHGTVFINKFDPMSLGIAAGLAGKAHFSDKVALFFDPKIVFEVSDRDLYKDALFVPLELGFQAGAKTQVKLLTGILGQLSEFGDTYQVPVGLGVVQNLNKHFDLGARFSFDNLLGNQPEGVGAADTRSVAVLLNIRS
jgi:hypothetical protein